MKKYFIVACAAGVIGFVSCKKKTEPTVCISADQTDVLVGEVIQFTNCSENYLNSEWNFGDGANTNVTDPSHRFSEAGEHTVHLKVVDMEGNSEASSSTITVNNLRLKQVDIVDADLSNAAIRFVPTVGGLDLSASSNVTTTSSSAIISYIFTSPTLVYDAEMDLDIAKQEEMQSQWFGAFWETTDEYAWKTNPFDELGEDLSLEYENSLEGLTVTLTFERTTE